MGLIYLSGEGALGHTVPRRLSAPPGLAPVMSYRQMEVVEHGSPRREESLPTPESPGT